METQARSQNILKLLDFTNLHFTFSEIYRSIQSVLGPSSQFDWESASYYISNTELRFIYRNDAVVVFCF